MRVESLSTKTRLGIAVGFLATAISLPFVGDKKISATDDVPNAPKILTQKDHDLAFNLAIKDSKDLRKQEIDWVNLVHPTVRTRLINLYKAEEEDNELLRKGKITEKDRKVKIYYAAFLKSGQQGDDMAISSDPNFDVAKYYDEKQRDGTVLRTYVFEYWPLNNETGGILPTETIRIRVQAFKGSLYEKGANKHFVTDQIHIIWSDNFDGSKGEATIYPFFYRQHLYGPLIKNKDSDEKENETLQMESFIGAPTWCAACHITNHGRSHELPKVEIKRKNYGAIISDEEFELPYKEHPGFKSYMAYLGKKVKQGKTIRDFMDRIARDLQNSTNMENPYIVEALKGSKTIPWVEGDVPLERKFECNLDRGFTYKEDGKTWKRAGYEYYRNFHDFTSLGAWWFRKDGQLIPKSH